MGRQGFKNSRIQDLKGLRGVWSLQYWATHFLPIYLSPYLMRVRVRVRVRVKVGVQVKVGVGLRVRVTFRVRARVSFPI